MLKRTQARLDNMLSEIGKLHEDMRADFDDMFDIADLDPLPEGVTEERTVEEKVLPDGTTIKTTVVRRVTKK